LSPKLLYRHPFHRESSHPLASGFNPWGNLVAVFVTLLLPLLLCAHSQLSPRRSLPGTGSSRTLAQPPVRAGQPFSLEGVRNPSSRSGRAKPASVAPSIGTSSPSNRKKNQGSQGASLARQAVNFELSFLPVSTVSHPS